MSLIRLENVVREYRLPNQRLFGPRPVRRALDGVSLAIGAGERWGVVGESGSGKTTLVRLVMGLEAPTSGSVEFDGRPVHLRRPADLRHLWTRAQLVFQDPMGSLDPYQTVDRIIAEPLEGLAIPGDRRARVAELLAAVGLPADSGTRYPHQFSGGQRQRIAIARALAPRPAVLVADEPVSALDVSVRAQILNLLRDLATRYGLTLVFVAHDLDTVRYLTDHVAVVRSGRIVESGPTERVYTEPAHPYTRELLAAIPRLPYPV